MNTDPRLGTWIRASVERLESRFAAAAPVLGAAFAAFVRQLTRGREPAEYFLHPDAFPSHLLPLFCSEALGLRDEQLLADICESTVYGTYAIRLIDNAADGDSELDLRLLPAVHLLGSGFEAPYHRHFPDRHPFWIDFHAIWAACAEATYRDAAEPPASEAEFRSLAARKISAAKIPLAAVCHHAGQAESLPAWCHFVDLLGCWHQMLYDVFDWHKDDRHDQQTYFLAEAARRRGSEPLAAWVAREGFAWGMAQVENFLAEVKTQAALVGSAALPVYLEDRHQRLLAATAKIDRGLQTLTLLSQLARPAAKES